ncbi:MAG: argininosuccinate lyase [Erysipelotrichaceae bacterium]|nr:argininosuccinate lyase [Erysipelotrichaceae bacterium]
MAKMWAGRTDGITDQIADDFNSSIHFDCRLYNEDITGSMAHAAMLKKQGIIPAEAAEHIIEGLAGILADLKSGKLAIDESCEDIHMFVEQVLTERIGDEGKMLHTARSRNDQVALDMRMYMRTKVKEIIELIKELIEVLNEASVKYIDVIMPGYTHLQRAQPIFFSQHLLAYEMMLLRDVSRLNDALERMDESPIGACALAGTTYDTDREYEAELLGFSGISANSMDAVSDRDYCIELLSCFSILMMHLSRFSEEIILWSSWEFRFIELSDAYTTGSSIMPQKKNCDMAELTRGKTGRVYGDLMSLLTVMKGIPLAYNKDMQEDKEPVFDAVNTVIMCLRVYIPMIANMKINSANMLRAAQSGFINATDLADYMVKKGLPFRSAYKISGQIVAECIRTDQVLETLPLSEYSKYWDQFDEDLYEAIDLVNAAEKRTSKGGTSRVSIREQIELVNQKLAEMQKGTE